MNKVYRLVWNATLNAWVAASEIAKSHRKGGGLAGRVAAAVTAVVLGLSGGEAMAYTVDPSSVVNLGAVADDGGNSKNTALGSGAVANAAGAGGSTAVGSAASATGLNSTAVGQKSSAVGASSVAIGDSAVVSNQLGVAIGALSNVSADYAIAIGDAASASSAFSIAMGWHAITGASLISGSSGQGAIAIGDSAKAAGDGAVTLGYNASSADSGAAAVGYGANAGASYSSAFGSTAQATNGDATALGAGANATGAAATAVGRIAKAGGNASVAIGYGPSASGYTSFAGGTQSNASGDYSNALGYLAQSTASGSIAVGTKANAAGTNSVALGRVASASVDSGIALGASSVASTASGVAGYVPVGANAAQSAAINSTKSTYGSASVGDAASNVYRQINGVAAGTQNSDAVNVAQLKAVPIAHYYSVNDSGTAGSNYNNDGASGVNALAAGIGATATGSSGLAMGNSAKSTNNDTIAIGHNAVASSANPAHSDMVAIGLSANASSDHALAIGTSASATSNNTTAVGVSALASGPAATALGHSSSASGSYSTAIGSGANASKGSAVAIGYGSKGAGDNSAAIGYQAATSATNALAIGNSANAQTGATSGIAIGNAAMVSGGAVNAVALGSGATTSAVDGVALGAGSVASTAAGVSGYDPSTKLASSDTSATWKSTLGAVSVGDASKGKTRQITGVAAGLVGSDAVNVAQLMGATADAVMYDDSTHNTITLGGDTYDNSTHSGGTSITNVANGVKDSDAVNVSQLNDLANTPITFIGNTGSVDKKLGEAFVIQGAATTAGSYSGANLKTEVDANGNLQLQIADNAVFDSVTTGNTTISNDGLTIVGGPSVTTVGVDAGGLKITNVAPGDVNAGSTDAINGSQLNATNQQVDQNTTDISNVTTNINNGTIGPVQRTGTDQLSLIAAGGDASAPGVAQVLNNVADGAINSVSTDAINGSQLYDLASSTANALGGGSAVNADGSISAPTYFVDGTTINNVGDAITNIDGRVTQNTINITALQQDALQWNGSLGAYDASHGTADPQKITNVAAGELSDTSTDAVNGSQLYATNQQVNQNTTDISNVTNSINNINNGVAGPVQRTGTDQLSLIAAGGDAYAPGAAQVLTNVAAGAITDTSTDAINGSQLFATNQQVDANTTNISNLDGRVTNVEGDVTTLQGDVTNLGDHVENIYNTGTKYFHANSTGTDSMASGVDSVAIGMGAIASHDGSIALGAGSIADGSTLDSEAYLVGGKASGEVNIGERRITGLSAGAEDADAVNVAQLKAITSSSVADAVMYDNSTHNSITLGGDSYDNSTHIGGTTITNLANGMNDSDAVNVSQLNETNTQVANIDNRVTNVEGDVTTLQGDVTNLGDHVENIYNTGTKYFHANSTGTDSVASGVDSVAIGMGAVASHDGSIALGAGSVADGSTLGNQAYLVGGTATGEVNVGGRRVTGLSAGAEDTDAVNVAQLKQVSGAATEGAVKYDLNGDGTINYNSVTMGGSTYNSVTRTGGTKITNVARGVDDSDAVNMSQLNETNAQVTNIDGRVTTIEGSITNINNGGGIKYFHANSAKADSVASGADSIAIGPNAQASGKGSIAMGDGASATADGSVAMGQGASDNGRGAESYTGKYSNAANASVGTVSVGNAATGETRTISNVADGKEATDAVNLRQLDGAVAESKQYTDDSIHNVNTEIANVTTNVSNLDNRVTKVEGDVTNVQNGTDGMFQVNNTSRLPKPKATGSDSVAGGAGAEAVADNSTAIGSNAKAKGRNSVAIGANSVAQRDNSVSVGSVGAERQITNVAAGSADTDAVNVAQLNKSVGDITSNTNAYTDSVARGLRKDIDELDNDLSAGIAGAMAMASLPQPYSPGASMAAAGAGTYRGQGAVAVGVSRISDNGKWVTKLQGSTTTQGDVGVSVGVGYQW
ncbi:MULTISPECIES: YadA-like family protein [Pseudomonas]|nr:MULTISPECIES: YadA-like family protein [Pseudomonas]QJP08630.1 hypothetical protein G4G71_12335 [Pseudomonas multiresinivorans]